MEINRYYHDHLDRLDEGPSPQPDVTEAEMFAFLAITISMGHCIRDKLTDYWSRADIFHTTFYGNANATGQISSHSSLSALHRQQEGACHGRKF